MEQPNYEPPKEALYTEIKPFPKASQLKKLLLATDLLLQPIGPQAGVDMLLTSDPSFRKEVSDLEPGSGHGRLKEGLYRVQRAIMPARAQEQEAKMVASATEYNKGFFDKLLDLRRAVLWDQSTVRDKVAGIEEYVRSKTHQKRTLGDVASLQQKLQNNIQVYEESPVDLQAEEGYAQLLTYVGTKYAESLVVSTNLTAQDVDKQFYLPQLNMVAKLTDHYFSARGTELHFEDFSLNRIPLDSKLIAIPFEKIFPQSSAKDINQTETAGKPEPASLRDYLDQIISPKMDQPVSMSERIRVNSNIPDEIAINLILHGANPYQLTRGDLLNSGYVFMNAIGDAEKFIISKTVEVEGQPINLGRLPFLTKAQLDASLKLDKEELKNVPITPQEIAIDIADVLHGSDYFLSKRANQIKAQLQTEGGDVDALKKKVDERLGAEWEAGKGYFFRKRIEELVNESGDLATAERQANQEFAEGKITHGDKSSGLETPFLIGGKGVMRLRKLAETQCPFLECACRFPLNRDKTYISNIGSSLVRINTMVAHLAAHGLSERGDDAGSGDQHYMTMKEYYDQIIIPQSSKES